MTDEIIVIQDKETAEALKVEEVEVFNPYDPSAGDNFYVNRAWAEGKANRVRNIISPFGTEATANPYNETDQPDRYKAYQEGYEGTGVPAHAFNYPEPTDVNGIFVMPDVATLDWEGTRRTHAVMAWQYDENADKQDPKVRPLWANFPISARSIRIADAHAWGAVNRWMGAGEIRGSRTIELPCPPYGFEADGNRLTITGGFFSKSGSKQEWTQVLKQMQEEVDDLPDGVYVGDDYVDVNLQVTKTGTVTLSVSSLLDGHDQYDGENWMGDEDDYHSAITEAVDDYDFMYEASDIDDDYPDVGVIDVDTSDLTSF